MAEQHVVERLADGAVRDARRIRTRRWAIVTSTALLVAGMATGVVVLVQSQTAPLAPSVAPNYAQRDAKGGGQATTPGPASANAAIYIAALRDRPVPEVGMDDRHLYVEDMVCGGEQDGAQPCDLEQITATVQADVRAALPEVRFVSRIEAAQLHDVVLVRFGPITFTDGSATRAHLPIGVHCGMLCGEGTTFVLAVDTDGTWSVVGTTGRSWIS